ncbi:MAG: hypothetical protein ACR2QM_15670 [Longimicrobiales bacterium]
MKSESKAWAPWVAFALIVLAPRAGVQAQTSADGAQAPIVKLELLSHTAGADLISLRADQLLAHRVQDAEDILRSLDLRASDVRALEQELEMYVEVKKREIDLTKADKDLANKEKRETDKAELERKQKRQEAERKLLERQRDAAEEKLEFYEAQRDLMQAQIISFGLEADLNRRVSELDALADAEESDVRRRVLVADIPELERSTLTAMEGVADAERDASSRRKRFIRAQLDVIKVRNELIALGG